MNFQETIYELAKQTEEIEVYACGAWSGRENERDIGIRSGCAPANAAFHDPVIDDVPFMICGDIFEDKNAYHRKTLIEDVDEYGLVDEYVVKLRAVGGYPPYEAVIRLGTYSIESIERVMWRHKYYSTERVLKLKLKRING